MSSEKTSVQVGVRIRPITNEDLINLPTRFQKSVLSTAPFTPNQVIVSGEKKQSFSYDYVFGPESTQKDVYDRAVLKLVDKFLEGYNVTILAYGQTSSGKTFTMGTSDNEQIEPDDKGIIPRAVSTLFNYMNSAQYKTRKFSIKVSFIEIYNEDLIDLLGEGEGESRPQVLIREDSKGNILWSGLQEIKVNSVEEVIAYLNRGSLSRQTGATDMNSKSSRSHAVFSVTLAQQKFTPAPGSNSSPQPLNDSQQKSGVRPPSRSSSRLGKIFDDGEWVSVTSKFHFVDLAGSERLKRTSAVGERVKEGISINSGLLALGNVISALGDPNKAKHITHIPYRDSKLTRLLQDSLGGNAQTLMIACVSPAEYNLTETVNTLKYANRARNIKNIAFINAEEAGWHDVEHLQNLVIKLRNEIKNLKNVSGVVTLNGVHTNGTTSGRTTPNMNGRETPSNIKRSSTPSFSNIPQSINGRETPGNLKRSSTPSNIPQSVNGRETPSHIKRPSSSLSMRSQQQKIQNNKDIETLEEQLQQLKSSYVKLSQRYAKTSAELAKHQDNYDDNLDGNSLSVIKETDDDDEANLINPQFKEAVEPVIEEYEKSFTALESQFAITKAALSHSESVIQEQQSKLNAAEETEEQSKIHISELKNKIAKLTERESTMERYIKDLENKLEGISSDQMRDQDLINELKSEMSQMRTNGSNSEGYIQDIENRLYKSETGSSKLSETIAKLESRLQQREAAYLELEKRLNQVESNEEKELLLNELDNREKRILVLEQNVESLMNELEELKELKEYGNFSRPGSIVPEIKNENDPTLITTLESKFSELQKTHEKTLQEFESIKSKYQSCLLEIHELQNQLTEAKLIHSETIKSTPTTPMSPQSPGLGNSFRLSLPPLNRDYNSLNFNNNINNNNNNNNNNSNNNSKHKRSKSFSVEIYGSDKRDDAHIGVIQRLHNEYQQLFSLHEDKAQGLDIFKQEFARLEIKHREAVDVVEELREEIKRRDALAQLEVMSVIEHVERAPYHSTNGSEADELELVQRLREEVEQLKEEQRITMESLSEREKASSKNHEEVLRIESSIQELRGELRYALEKSNDDKDKTEVTDVKDDERVIELQSRVKELELELVKAQELQKQEQIAEASARLEGANDSSETDKNINSSKEEEILELRQQAEKLQSEIESKCHTIAALLLPTSEHQNTIRRLEDELQEVREAQQKAIEEQGTGKTNEALEAKVKELEVQLIKAKEAQHIPTPRSSFLHVVDPTQRDITKLQDKLSDLQRELALKSETIQNLKVEQELVASLQSQLEILKDDINRKYELIEVLKKDLVDKGMLQQKLREKEAEATALQSQLLTIKKHDSELQQQMKVLQSQLLKLEGSPDGDLNLHDELENVRKELKETKENEKLAIERLRILSAEESKLQQDLQRLRQEDIAQKERIKVLEESLSQKDLESDKDLVALRTELTLTKETEATQQQKILELENKLEGSETEISSLRSKIVEISDDSNSKSQHLVSEIKNLQALESERKQHIETLESKLKQGDIAIVNMKDELSKLKETESQLKSTIKELENKLVQAEKENEQIQKIKGEINLLRELDAEQKSNIEQLQSELEKTKADKDAAIEELESNKEDFAAQKELVITLEGELKNVREELTKANEQNINSGKKLEELSIMIKDSIMKQDEEEEKKKLLENELEMVKSQRETGDKNVYDLKIELETLRKEKEARNKRLSEIENQISIVENERNQHLERVSELTKLLETKENEKKEAVTALENKVSDLQLQLEQVKESSRVDQETIESLGKRLATLDSQLVVAKESDEKYARMVSELETKLKESNALLSEKEQSLTDKNSKYVELEAIIEKTRAELENSKASNSNQIEQLETDLEESKVYLDQQSELISALESQLIEAEKQRDDHISKLAEANSEIETLREKCSSLQTEINDVHDDSLLQSYSNVDENMVEDLSRELKKAQEEALVQQERADTLQKKSEMLQSEKNNQLVINADLAQQVEQLQKELESLAEEFSDTVTKQEDNEIQLKERISELESALEETKNMQRVSTSDASNPALVKLAAANESLRQTNDELHNKISEAEQRASSLSERVRTLESELEGTKSANNDSLKLKIQDLESEKRVLEQANELSFEERQKLDQKIESLLQQLQASGRNGNKTATHLSELNKKILSLEKEISQAKQKAKEDNSEISRLQEINEQLEQELSALTDAIRDSGNSLDSGYISQASTQRTLKTDSLKFYRQESTIAQQNNLIKTLRDKISELERQAEENSSRSNTPIAAELDAVGGYRATSPKNAGRSGLPPTPPPNQPLPKVPPSPGAPPNIPLPPKPAVSDDLTVEKLNKRIAKLEGDNSQNRQLVDTLENSLNDSESNLRIAKQQLQVLQREKSDLVNQMKSLKMQLEDAAAQYEQAKSSVQQEKKVIENVLIEERKAKEQAERSKRMLESRMEELIAKKSKFMCF